MAMRFQNKVALVTGGASGIGKEVATRFVTEGGSVVINGRGGAKAEAVAREIDPTGKRVVVHAGDIALPATGEAVVKTAIDRFGRLDVLFNNAGIFTPKPFLEVEEAEYDRFLDIILKGKFFAAHPKRRASAPAACCRLTAASWPVGSNHRHHRHSASNKPCGQRLATSQPSSARRVSVITRTHNKLFTPVQVGAITLKHRIVMPPLSRLRVAEWRSERSDARIL